MPFNFSSSEYLSHHRTRKNRVSPVSWASPTHMNSPLDMVDCKHFKRKQSQNSARSLNCTEWKSALSQSANIFLTHQTLVIVVCLSSCRGLCPRPWLISLFCLLFYLVLLLMSLVRTRLKFCRFTHRRPKRALDCNNYCIFDV